MIRTIDLALMILMLGAASTSTYAQKSADDPLAELQKLYAPKSHDERLAEAQQRAAIKEATLGPDNDDTLYAQWSVANLLRRKCRDQEAAVLEGRIHPKLLPRRAEGLMRHAEKVESRGGTPTGDLTEAGDVLVKLERLSDARRAYDRAIAGLEKSYRENHTRTPLEKSLQYATAKAGIAEVNRLEGRFVEAEQGYRDAIAIFDEFNRPDKLPRPFPVAWLDSLEMIYRARHLEQQADAIRQRAASRHAQLERARGCKKH